MTSVKIAISSDLANGIEFSCQMCGKCCTGFNEGEVYLYKEDILRLAKYLNFRGKEGLTDFAEKYLKVVNDSFYWKEPKAERGKTYRFKTLGLKFTGDDEHCHFLIDNKCSVHVARPFQCRSFPFWKMMVSSKKNFDDYTEKCKGLQLLKGKFYTREEILKWARDEYEIERNYFLKMKRFNFDILKVYPFLSKKMLEE
ncbi:MAG: YkgJ family cysteine cluster protein [Candidatus Odinarchaeota archaeon]